MNGEKDFDEIADPTGGTPDVASRRSSNTARFHWRRDLDMCLLVFLSLAMAGGAYLLTEGIPFLGRRLSLKGQYIVLYLFFPEALGMVITSVWLLVRRGVFPSRLRDGVPQACALISLLGAGHFFYVAWWIATRR
ncbi:MAG: hypothetical protein GY851_16670 [bacterium]|nr:hypothetical protein [bacterium]